MGDDVEDVPAIGMRLIVAPDGTAAALIEGDRLRIVRLPDAATLAELPATLGTEVAWVGARMLALEPSGTVSVLSLIDPAAATTIASLQLDGELRLEAAVGSHALLVGHGRAVMVAVNEMRLLSYPMPLRGSPSCGGAAGRNFVLALAGSIDEWDPAQRAPRRRLVLPRQVHALAVGGSDRVVWLLAHETPERIDAIPLVDRGQPRVHELPEPLVQVCGHPDIDVLACRGASGATYLVDLDGRVPYHRVDVRPADAIGLLATGGRASVVLVRAGEPIEVVAAITDRELPRPRSTMASQPAATEVADDPDIARGPLPAELLQAAAQSLAPRTDRPLCSASQYQELLESYRRNIAALAALAIAKDWDTGRLSFSPPDRPPHEAEVLGILGRRGGSATDRVREAELAVRDSATALVQALDAVRGRLSPYQLLCDEHGVDALGARLLIAIAAPSLWGELARLYGILANDPARPMCDEHLLWQLLNGATTRRDLARQLDPDAPLVRYGIVRVADTARRPFLPLSVDPVVLKLLSGSSVDGDTERGMTLAVASATLDAVDAPRDVLLRALGELAATPGNARIVVRGRIGRGRRTLLAALAKLARRKLAVIDLELLVRERALPDLAPRLQRAHLRGALPCLDGFDSLALDDLASRAAIREIVRNHAGPVALRLGHETQPPIEPGYVAIDLPISTTAQRARQWDAALARHELSIGNVDELAARFSVGPGTIRTVAATVARTHPEDVAGAIDAQMRQHLESRLGTVAQRVTRLADWSQVVLPSEIEDSLLELISRIRHRRTVFDTWGLDRVMSTSRGLTALFQGGPGTGKTMVASAIASELKVDLYRVDLSRVLSKWIGETEQNLGKVFDAGEEGHAIILFDEADALFGARTNVKSSNDRYANVQVNYLLQRLDTFEGIAILTTNFGTAIDAAFKRRLSCRVTFPFPDEDARAKLWAKHLPAELPRAGKLDLVSLARRYKMSGGYIRNTVLRAAFLAAQEGAVIAQSHLERAVRAEFHEGGKLGESGQLE